MRIYDYYMVRTDKRDHKGERYFKVAKDSDTVVQICASAGEAKRGKGNLFGVSLISRLTFLSNYYQYQYVMPCKEALFTKKFEEVISQLRCNKPDEYELKLPIGIMKEHCREDFTNGANHGYSLAMEQHRDFYLLVRELLKAMHFTTTEEFNLFKKTEIGIKKHLAAFTEREQQSLPFKD